MRRELLAVAVVAAAVAAARPCAAHHILGIPHYAYDEQYPQTPVLTYRVEAGPYEVKMTGYPGVPEPGERLSLHVYIRDRRTGAPFAGGVTATVMRDRLLGEDPVVYGPVRAELEESVYKFYPELEEEANYVARVEFEVAGAPWRIDLPIVVGEPGAPWQVLGWAGGGVAVFLLVIRAVRIKRRRGARARRRTGPASLSGGEARA